MSIIPKMSFFLWNLINLHVLIHLSIFKKYYVAMIETIGHISLNRIQIFLNKPSFLYLYLQFHTSADGLLDSAVS